VSSFRFYIRVLFGFYGRAYTVSKKYRNRRRTTTNITRVISTITIVVDVSRNRDRREVTKVLRTILKLRLRISRVRRIFLSRKLRAS